jgi:hypothetical protein
MKSMFQCRAFCEVTVGWPQCIMCGQEAGFLHMVDITY